MTNAVKIYPKLSHQLTLRHLIFSEIVVQFPGLFIYLHK